MYILQSLSSCLSVEVFKWNFLLGWSMTYSIFSMLTWLSSCLYPAAVIPHFRHIPEPETLFFIKIVESYKAVEKNYLRNMGFWTFLLLFLLKLRRREVRDCIKRPVKTMKNIGSYKCIDLVHFYKENENFKKSLLWDFFSVYFTCFKKHHVIFISFDSNMTHLDLS